MGHRIIPTAVFLSLLIALVAAPAGKTLAEEIVVEARMVDDLKAVFAAVESVDTARARSRIGGTLRNLSIDEGSQVKEGQHLARIEDKKLALQLAANDSRIRAADAEAKLAQLERDRFAQLRRSGTASQAAMDTAETRLSVVTGNLAALKAERAVIVEQQAEGDILAPVSGRVLNVEVTDGQVVVPGETIAVIAAEAYILRLHLPERHARFLKEGDSVLVGERGLGETEAGIREGQVSQVYPELDHGRVVADVRVSGLGDYFVGERTRVYVATGKRAAITVPRRAVFLRSGVSYVRLIGVGESVVQVGLPRDGGIEILSGLRPGDRIELSDDADSAKSRELIK